MRTILIAIGIAAGIIAAIYIAQRPITELEAWTAMAGLPPLVPRATPLGDALARAALPAAAFIGLTLAGVLLSLLVPRRRARSAEADAPAGPEIVRAPRVPPIAAAPAERAPAAPVVTRPDPLPAAPTIASAAAATPSPPPAAPMVATPPPLASPAPATPPPGREEPRASQSFPERGEGPTKAVEGLPPPDAPLHQPAAGPPPRAGEDQGLSARPVVASAPVVASPPAAPPAPPPLVAPPPSATAPGITDTDTLARRLDDLDGRLTGQLTQLSAQIAELAGLARAQSRTPRGMADTAPALPAMPRAAPARPADPAARARLAEAARRLRASLDEPSGRA